MNAKSRDSGQGVGSLVPLSDDLKRFGAVELVNDT
jgi:hypothetical protein